MKKNVTMWIAVLTLMVSACGGSGSGGNEAGSTGSERPEVLQPYTYCQFFSKHLILTRS